MTNYLYIFLSQLNFNLYAIIACFVRYFLKYLKDILILYLTTLIRFIILIKYLSKLKQPIINESTIRFY